MIDLCTNLAFKYSMQFSFTLQYPTLKIKTLPVLDQQIRLDRRQVTVLERPAREFQRIYNQQLVDGSFSSWDPLIRIL